eukprot:10064663-Ditylum_brightwellii.AAC.1
MEEVITATMVKLRCSCCRLFILPLVRLMKKGMRVVMVKLRAGCHRLFILSDTQDVEKVMRAAMEEVARDDDNGSGRSGNRPSKMSYDSSHFSVIPKKCPSRPFKVCTKKNR